MEISNKNQNSKKKYDKTILLVCLIIGLVVLFGILCIMRIFNNSNFDWELEVLFNLKALHNGDAKLLDNNVTVTSVEGRLTFIDSNGTILKSHEDTEVAWLDTEDQIIVYGNGSKQIGIIIFDEEYNICSNNVIMNITETLGIDPSLCKVDDEYYITVTHIDGAVNLDKESEENGEYWLNLYKSHDLLHWDFVTEVVRCKNNIEDIDLNYYDGILYLSYEKEVRDKKASSINVLMSKDYGESWGENQVLVEQNADNEPASLIRTSDQFVLFYSSDISSPGDTYEEAKCYYQIYDEELAPIHKPKEIPLKNRIGNLLYDINWIDGQLYCLFSQKYISESNLILEQLKMNCF